MSSFRKIIYSSLLFITACGFSPLYTGNDPSRLIGQISIQEPNSQDEFIFYSRLVDRFDQAEDKYVLNYAITSTKEDRALNFDGTELLYDKEEMYLTYSNAGSTAAVLNAERDTNKQLIILLADKVADRISLTIVEEKL